MLSLFVLNAFAEAPPTTTYTVAADSRLAVLVSYDRSAIGGGHDHVIAPNKVTGTITWNVADPSACDVFLEFPVTALRVDPAGARARFGLEGETSAGDKKSIRSNLAGKHQLQASVFPSISFQSTACKSSGDTVEVTGDLSIHGVKKSVTSAMTVQADGSSFHATGAFSAKHSDFGITPFSAMLGALRNDQKLGFRIDVRASADR